MIGSVIIFIIYFIRLAWKDLKDRVTELEGKNGLVTKMDIWKLQEEVMYLRRGFESYQNSNRILMERMERMERNRVELIEKINKVDQSKMDTSLIALLNDGLIKELSKEDKPNPPKT